MAAGVQSTFRAPGHPWTTIIFVTVNWLVVVNSFYRYRANALLLLGILLAGVPLYFYWSRSQPRRPQT
jgi:APA family basic amino acid/polyamine antiporter